MSSVLLFLKKFGLGFLVGYALDCCNAFKVTVALLV